MSERSGSVIPLRQDDFQVSLLSRSLHPRLEVFINSTIPNSDPGPCAAHLHFSFLDSVSIDRDELLDIWSSDMQPSSGPLQWTLSPEVIDIERPVRPGAPDVGLGVILALQNGQGKLDVPLHARYLAPREHGYDTLPLLEYGRLKGGIVCGEEFHILLRGESRTSSGTDAETCLQLEISQKSCSSPSPSRCPQETCLISPSSSLAPLPQYGLDSLGSPTRYCYWVDEWTLSDLQRLKPCKFIEAFASSADHPGQVVGSITSGQTPHCIPARTGPAESRLIIEVSYIVHTLDGARRRMLLRGTGGKGNRRYRSVRTSTQGVASLRCS